MDTLLGGVDVRDLSTVAVWMLGDTVLRVTLLLAAVAGLAWALRRASATVRHLVWCLGVCGALTLPLLSVLLPTWELAVLPAPARRAREVAPARVAVQAPVEVQAQVVRPLRVEVGRRPEPLAPRGERTLAVVVPAAPVVRVPVTLPAVTVAPRAAPVRAEVAPAAAPRTAGPWAWVLGTWLLGAVLVSLRLVLARVAVWHLGARAGAVEDGRLLSQLQAILRRLGVERSVRLLESDAVSLPVTWGVLHPTVLLPLDAHLWTPERLEQVLLHELAHVKRLDALTQLLAQLACAFYWFHPLVWLAERRMRTLREYACDDQVLAAGTRASDYARELLELVRTMGRTELAHSATLAMARPSQLEGRLRAILDPAQHRAALGRMRAALLGMGAFALVLPLAALQPAHAAGAEEAPRTERRARSLPRLSAEESARRRSDYQPEPLEQQDAPAPRAAAEDEPQRNTWMSDPVEVERRRAREESAREEAAREEAAREEAAPAPARPAAPASPATPAAPAPSASPALPAAPAEPARPALPVPAPAPVPQVAPAPEAQPRARTWQSREDSGDRRVEDAIARAVHEAHSEEELARGLKDVLRQSDLEQERERQAFLEATGNVRDPELRATLLVQVLRQSRITPETGRALLERARGIGDDAQLSRVLGWVHRIHESDVMYGPLMVDVLKTVEVLRTPEARSRALRQVLDEAPVSVETGRSVLALAAGLGNDRLTGNVLARMHDIRERELVRGPLARDYLEVTRRLSSDEEQVRALVGLLNNQPLSREATLGALEVARSIRSAGGRRAVLMATSGMGSEDPEVLRAVEQLARSIPGMTPESFAQLQREPSRQHDGDEDVRKDKDKDGKRRVWVWSGLSDEERERIREEVRRAREQAREEAQRAREQALAEAQRGREEAQRGREEAQRVREEAQRAREQAREEAQRAREQAREEARRAREEAERAREEAESEARTQRDTEQERGRSRERIQAEMQRFQEAKEALRANAEQLREQADRLAAQMRERVKEIRERVKQEVERSGLEDVDVDDTFDYDFDVDIDVK